MQTDKVAFTCRGQTMLVQQLTMVNEVLEQSELLYEGLVTLCDRKGARADVEWVDFLQRIFAIAVGVYTGAIFVFYSKNNKPLGFTVLIEDTESKSRRTIFVYAGYSRTVQRDSGRCAMEFICRWAKVHNYVEVRAQSRRVNGAAMRYFRKVLGFVTLSVLFKKDL